MPWGLKAGFLEVEVFVSRNYRIDSTYPIATFVVRGVSDQTQRVSYRCSSRRGSGQSVGADREPTQNGSRRGHEL